jgi:pyrroloquinoline quinone biosynthesis protein B
VKRRHLLAALAAACGWPSGAWHAGARAATMMPLARKEQGASAEAIVLGTAQDAGVPQINCFSDNCTAVRSGQRAAPLVACVGLIDHVAGRRFLLDATPDIVTQLGALLTPTGEPPAALGGSTVPLHEILHGIFLTHAHIGHYTGLVHLGKEGAAPRRLPVFASQHMCEFLSANAPWDALVEGSFIELRPLTPGRRVQISTSLAITPFEVAHRAEYTDTLGYRVHGPRRTLMYVPDADVWDGWDTPFDDLLRASDVALIDGSFWSYDELGHRAQGNIPHPPVSQTLERLHDMDDLPEIRFIHLNHTNPLWDAASPLRRDLPQGFGVAETGQRLPL